MEHQTVVKKSYGGGDAGIVWFLGVIGATVYYLQNAGTFMEGVVGVLKALVWPAILVYYALRTMGL